jgi:hypothetical protein
LTPGNHLLHLQLYILGIIYISFQSEDNSDLLLPNKILSTSLLQNYLINWFHISYRILLLKTWHQLQDCLNLIGADWNILCSYITVLITSRNRCKQYRYMVLCVCVCVCIYIYMLPCGNFEYFLIFFLFSFANLQSTLQWSNK